MVDRPNADAQRAVKVRNHDIDVIMAMFSDLAVVSPTLCAGAHVDHRLRRLKRTLVNFVSISRDLG